MIGIRTELWLVSQMKDSMNTQRLLLVTLLAAAFLVSACTSSAMVDPTEVPPTKAPEPTVAQPTQTLPFTETPEPVEAPTQSGNGDVIIVDSSYRDKSTTVTVGTTVIWTHDGQLPHTVTLDDGSVDSDSLSSGDMFSFTFDQAGTFAYYCRFHGGPGGKGMSGTIIVTGE